MLILLTNDDGINAPGILAAYHALTKLGEVHVVAPETVQSATGHGVTLSTPLLTSEVTMAPGVVGTAVDGRPADCVKLAVSQLLPRRPDLVVSGINSGANVGINVIYSGTVAAAIEAAFLKLPSVTLSLLLKRDVPIDYDRAARQSIEVIEDILGRGLQPGQVASVNLPALQASQSPAGRCRRASRPRASSIVASVPGLGTTSTTAVPTRGAGRTSGRRPSSAWARRRPTPTSPTSATITSP